MMVMYKARQKQIASKITHSRPNRILGSRMIYAIEIGNFYGTNEKLYILIYREIFITAEVANRKIKPTFVGKKKRYTRRINNPNVVKSPMEISISNFSDSCQFPKIRNILEIHRTSLMYITSIKLFFILSNSHFAP